MLRGTDTNADRNLTVAEVWGAVPVEDIVDDVLGCLEVEFRLRGITLKETDNPNWCGWARAGAVEICTGPIQVMIDCGLSLQVMIRELTDTIKHEICHVFVSATKEPGTRPRAHGKEWKDAMRKCGYKNPRTYAPSIRELKGEVDFSSDNRPALGQVVYWRWSWGSVQDGVVVRRGSLNVSVEYKWHGFDRRRKLGYDLIKRTAENAKA